MFLAFRITHSLSSLRLVMSEKLYCSLPRLHDVVLLADVFSSLETKLPKRF